MKKSIIRLIAVSLIVSFFMPSCATIMGKSSYPISMNSNPQGAEIIIKNKKGEEVYRGTTPASAKLPASSKYMSGETYAITLKYPGYKDHTSYVYSTINGWYFGNILLGGLIGMLIVDPLTGAMYKLDDGQVNATLVKSTEKDEAKLEIMNINDIPQEMKDKLVRIDK